MFTLYIKYVAFGHIVNAKDFNIIGKFENLKILCLEKLLKIVLLRIYNPLQNICDHAGLILIIEDITNGWMYILRDKAFLSPQCLLSVWSLSREAILLVPESFYSIMAKLASWANHHEFKMYSFKISFKEDRPFSCNFLPWFLKTRSLIEYCNMLGITSLTGVYTTDLYCGESAKTWIYCKAPRLLQQAVLDCWQLVLIEHTGVCSWKVQGNQRNYDSKLSFSLSLSPYFSLSPSFSLSLSLLNIQFSTFLTLPWFTTFQTCNSTTRSVYL